MPRKVASANARGEGRVSKPAPTRTRTDAPTCSRTRADVPTCPTPGKPCSSSSSCRLRLSPPAVVPGVEELRLAGWVVVAEWETENASSSRAPRTCSASPVAPRGRPSAAGVYPPPRGTGLQTSYGGRVVQQAWGTRPPFSFSCSTVRALLVSPTAARLRVGPFRSRSGGSGRPQPHRPSRSGSAPCER
jgi:hypothetical protein